MRAAGLRPRVWACVASDCAFSIAGGTGTGTSISLPTASCSTPSTSRSVLRAVAHEPMEYRSAHFPLCLLSTAVSLLSPFYLCCRPLHPTPPRYSLQAAGSSRRYSRPTWARGTIVTLGTHPRRWAAQDLDRVLDNPDEFSLTITPEICDEIRKMTHKSPPPVPSRSPPVPAVPPPCTSCTMPALLPSQRSASRL